MSYAQGPGFPAVLAIAFPRCNTCKLLAQKYGPRTARNSTETLVFMIEFHGSRMAPAESANSKKLTAASTIGGSEKADPGGR